MSGCNSTQENMEELESQRKKDLDSDLKQERERLKVLDAKSELLTLLVLGSSLKKRETHNSSQRNDLFLHKHKDHKAL